MINSKFPLKGVYPIIDTSLIHRHDLGELVSNMVRGGARMFQLRAKGSSSKEQLEIALYLRQVISNEEAVFIVNDRVDIALLSKAGGVHLGQEDIPCRIARDILGKGFIIGISTHNKEEALKAQEEGADYIAFGPIFQTKTKKDAGPAKGIGELKKIKEIVNIPVIAIGGIKEGNIKKVLETDVDGVAMISDILSSKDIAKKIGRLSSLFTCS